MRGYSFKSQQLDVRGIIRRNDSFITIKLNTKRNQLDNTLETFIEFFRENGFTIKSLYESNNMGTTSSSRIHKTKIGKGKTGLIRKEYIEKIKNQITGYTKTIHELLKKEKQLTIKQINQKTNIKIVTIRSAIKRLKRLNKIEEIHTISKEKLYQLKGSD